VIDLIGCSLNAPSPIRLTHSVAVSDGTKREEGTVMRTPPNFKSDAVAVADPRQTQRLTPATTKEASDILTNCRNWF
jgi:hypothetical protein